MICVFVVKYIILHDQKNPSSIGIFGLIFAWLHAFTQDLGVTEGLVFPLFVHEGNG